MSAVGSLLPGGGDIATTFSDNQLRLIEQTVQAAVRNARFQPDQTSDSRAVSTPYGHGFAARASAASGSVFGGENRLAISPPGPSP